MRSILGIDGGGTTTTFLAVDGEDCPIEQFQTGPSSFTSSGQARCRESLTEGIRRLRTLPDVVAAGFAGAGRPEAVDFYRRTLSDLLPESEILITTDANIACRGALGHQAGVVLVAGTGAIAIGRTAAGSYFRCGGWGPHFGDEGSGFWIGREAIRTAMAFAEDQRKSDFPEYVANRLNLKNIDHAISAYSSGDLTISRIAGLAGDLARFYPGEPAKGILLGAAAHLRHLVERARARVGPDCVITAIGSVGSQPVIRGLIGIRFSAPLNPPERGAVAWAREQLGEGQAES
jgi:N-acetylglucosamine kinase